MKKCLGTFSVTNTRGYSSKWRIHLESNAENQYALTCKNSVTPKDPISIRQHVSELEDGADIFDMVMHMSTFAGYFIKDEELLRIAEILTEIDINLGNQFRNGEELLEQRRAIAETKSSKVELDHILMPFSATIDNYVRQFSNRRLRYPTAGEYGTERVWARIFIENYILDHGQMPTGEHVIKLPGYTGKLHDFTDLK
jgi:hypothetical protein